MTVRLPTVLRDLAGGESTLDVQGDSVKEILAGLAATHPGFGSRIFDAEGRLRRFINVFVDDEDIRFADGLETAVKTGQTVSVLPAVAGGN